MSLTAKFKFKVNDKHEKELSDQIPNNLTYKTIKVFIKFIEAGLFIK